MAAAIVVDFDSNPRTIYGVAGSTVNVRFVDKSTTNNGVVNYWRWYFGDMKAFTGATSPNLVITDANTYFSVDDRVVLLTSGALPTGLSPSIVYYILTATATLVTLSLTSGGSVVTFTGGSGSGTHSIQHGSNVQNPITPCRSIAAGTRSIALTCDDSGSTGTTTTLKTDWLKIGTGTFTPPAQTTAYRNITLFVYERSNEAAPVGACICRAKTSACNLFFMNLQVNGAMTKAGKATFDIVNAGGGTAAEIDLFESTTISRYKNIAIIGGYDAIWSGKITKAEKELMSQPGTTPQKAVYHCEAYSDVKKLSDWNIIAASRGAQVGKSPGQLAALMLATNSGEPDFVGTKGGYIDPSGPVMQMTLGDTDKLTAFSSLTAATDYDWRTRMETMLFQYATFDGTDEIAITSAGFTIDALIGSWILFPTENYLLGGVSKPNRAGILAWGLITDNDATTITATVSGAATVPLTTDNCLIVGVPRMDFSSDLMEPTVVRAFMNGTSAVRFVDQDEKIDLFTKVVVKGKMIFSPSVLTPFWNISGDTYTVALAAKDVWDASKQFFQHSTTITQKTMGWIYSYAANATTVVLVGRSYAFKSGDVVGYFVYRTASGLTAGGTFTLNATPTTQIQPDGTPTTTLSCAAAIDAGSAWAKYGVIYGAKTYVKDNSIYTSGAVTLNVGQDAVLFDGSGVDATYGPYLSWSSNWVCLPHVPGCLISTQDYSETSPEAGSPVAVHGIVSKNITVDTQITPADLDVAATQALIQGSQYYQKSSMKAGWYQFTRQKVRDGVQLTGPAMIREGQRISVVPYTGGSAIERQVIEWFLDGNSMIVTVTLGDYVKDVWNILDRNTTATQKALL